MEVTRQCSFPETFFDVRSSLGMDYSASAVDVGSLFARSSSTPLATGSKEPWDPPACKVTRRRSDVEQESESKCCFVRVNMRDKEQFLYIPTEETTVTPLIVPYSAEKTSEWLQPRVSAEEQQRALEDMKRSFEDLGVSNSSPLAGTGASALVLKTCLGGKNVAVKIYRQGNTERYYSNELNVLSQIGVHPNIISIYGYCPSPYALIMEFSELGSLFDLLHDERDLTTRQTVIGGSTLVNSTTEACTSSAIARYGSLHNAIIMHRPQLAYDIARGMEYLHSRHCVHLDFTSRNMLLTSDFHVKITDFGLSVMTVDGELASRQLGHAPSYWKAPELCHRAPSVAGRCGSPSLAQTPSILACVEESSSVSSPAVGSEASTPSPPTTPSPLSMQPPSFYVVQKKSKRLFTPKVDVFSYGVVLWELFHPGKFPWNGDLHPDVRLQHGERPHISASVSPAWQMLIVACWQQSAQHRPSSHDIVCWLERNLTVLRSL